MRPEGVLGVASLRLLQLQMHALLRCASHRLSFRHLRIRAMSTVTSPAPSVSVHEEHAEAEDSNPKKPTRLRGFVDMFPQQAAEMRHVETTMQAVCERYGFREIRTPVLEKAQVFDRTLGTASDIVSKEMYQFKDEIYDVVLRPEGTAGVVRALAAQDFTNSGDDRYYYVGPMFRRERPQKGRYRQFQQFGVEMLGWSHPHADVECIEMGCQALDSLGLLAHTKLLVNSLGDSASRTRYRDALKAYFTPRAHLLSEASQHRLQTGAVLRILDSKDEKDIALIRGGSDEQKTTPGTSLRPEPAPLCTDYLTPDSRARFDEVQRALTKLGVPYQLDPYLIRGLDYYSHTAFEFIDTRIQDRQVAVLGGGRYDGLAQLLGAQAQPGVGWAAGVDRLAQMRVELGMTLPLVRGRTAVVVVREKAPASSPGPGSGLAATDDVTWFGLELVQRLRKAGFEVLYSFDRQVPKQMRHASDNNALVTMVVGETELASQTVVMKDMTRGLQEQVKLADLEAVLASKLDSLLAQHIADNRTATGHE